jgi:hypothetical protein
LGGANGMNTQSWRKNILLVLYGSFANGQEKTTFVFKNINEDSILLQQRFSLILILILSFEKYNKKFHSLHKQGCFPWLETNAREHLREKQTRETDELAIQHHCSACRIIFSFKTMICLPFVKISVGKSYLAPIKP